MGDLGVKRVIELANATKDKSAKTAAEQIYDDFVLRFENKPFYNLDKLIGAPHSRTTSSHPQGNGQEETFNRTLLSMFRSVLEMHKSR